MQHTCNQANDLIIVIQCNGFVSVVRNAFFTLGIWGFFLPATVFGLIRGPTYIYICICKCMYVYISAGVFSPNENETMKQIKRRRLMIY